MNSNPLKKCFVVSPFQQQFEEIFEYAIKPAANACGFDCERVKDIQGPINIIQQIIANIYEADAIVADLTGMNPNVFYELGVAHSVPVSNRTIMISQELDDLPFDIASFQVLKYEHNFEGHVALRESLKERIGFIQTNPGASTNPVEMYLAGRKSEKSRVVPPMSDDDLFEQVVLSKIRLEVLTILRSIAANEPAPTITDLQKRLSIQRRKFLVRALEDYLKEGWVVQEKAGGVVKWRLSEKGGKIVEKV